MWYISQITTEKCLWVSKHVTHANADTQETKWDILFICSGMVMFDMSKSSVNSEQWVIMIYC